MSASKSASAAVDDGSGSGSRARPGRNLVVRLDRNRMQGARMTKLGRVQSMPADAVSADVESALAEAIVQARGRAGLTQEEVALRMQTTQSNIARLEAGRT